jgi:RHS repeat-associated protein
MIRQLFRTNDRISKGKRYLLLVILFMLSLRALASEDPVIVTVFKGSNNEIKVDSVRETMDLIFYSSHKYEIDDTAKDVYRNTIALLIDEDDSTYISSDFTVSIWIKITWLSKNGTTDSIFKKLDIDYKKADSLKYDARNYFFFDNARRVKIEIDSIDIHGASWDPTTVLKLENRMEVRRDYIFSCGTSAQNVDKHLGDVSSENNFDELVVTWDAQDFAGITHYDVEWAWVDIDALDRYKISNQFDATLIFKNNSTRITTPASNSSYKVPLIYDGSGYLFFRVRPLQYREDGTIVEGIWSAIGPNGIDYYSYTDGHEFDLNWQVSTTYAEDGKRKTVIQYFDGTLRSRQTVTKDNVNNNTIVAETFYDYQGRPAINVLPSPTLNTVIEFAKNFNRFTATGDPKSIYDLVPVGQTICNSNAPPLNPEYAAARYYSSNNDKVNDGINKYIPDAEGYPYAETRYVPDATGRIAAQGGVGPAHQLGSNHETKYYYGSADQKELNALFGTEVGEDSHYFKNMVRDANGQFSVSYVDMHGRTIGTALAGNKPDNLQALESYPQLPHGEITKNLLSNNIVKGRSVESSTTLLVPETALHTFRYNLTPQSAEILACNPPNEPVCYDCYYDLEIRITGTCGDEPFIITRKNFTFGEYDVECNTPPPPFVVEEEYTLEAGEYNITKILTLSKDAQDSYRENLFTEKNICKTLEEFYNEIYTPMLANNNCNMTCETCEAELGDYNNYRTKFLQSQEIDPNTTVPYEFEIQASFNEAYANCQALCEEPESKLSSIRQQMLDDVTPDLGQYAKTDKDLNNDGTVNGADVIDHGDGYLEIGLNTKKPYNIFKSSSSFVDPIFNPLTYPFRNPRNKEDQRVDFYPDEFGQYNQSTIPALTDPLLTPDEFSDQFGPKWAEALLYYHPEYCKLKTAEDYLLPSYKWDAKVEAVNTWQDAQTEDFLVNILNLDPFFNGVGSSYKPAMLGLISQNYKAGNSMWQLAWKSVNCLNDPATNCGTVNATPPYTVNGCGDWNYVWRIFRTFYLSEKDKLVNQYLDAVCPINYTVLNDNGYTRRFATYDNYSSDFNAIMNQLTAIQNSGGNYQDQGDDLYNSQAGQLYKETCEGYIEMWKTKLLACDELTNNFTETERNAILTEITNGLKDVCIRGSDADHPFGSSTVKPGDNNTPQSFDEVIRAVFLAHNIDPSSICHPYLIDYPQPYERQQPLSDDIMLEPKDDCICGRIRELQAEQTQVGFTGTLSEFIQYQHGIFIRQTFLQDTLINGCIGASNCVTYDPPLEIPPILSCSTILENCIECAEYTTLKAQFMTEFPDFTIIYEEPQTEEEGNRNIAFERFMNSRAGLSKSWFEYLQFQKACSTYNVGWNCQQLKDVVTAFYQANPNAGTGSSCLDLFTQFFNQTFSTSLTFDQVEQLFMTHCGSMPDICEPVITCKLFKNIINDFYEEYGAEIAVASNCQSLFVTFFNNSFGTSYTWDELVDIHKKLCGYDLDVCGTFSCDRLQQVLDSWHGCHTSDWMGSNCIELWVSYFNGIMGTSLQAGEIENLYNHCNITLDPCFAPASCKTLKSLLQSYNNAGPDACPGLENPECNDCFTAYINERLGRNYSYEQIALMYQKTCGEDLQVCETRFKANELSDLSYEFVKWHAENPNAGPCDSLFTVQFNTTYGFSYTFEKIMAVYELYNGQMPEVCRKETLLTCEQIEGIYNSFLQLYPDPSGYFGNKGDTAYMQYFNQAVGDTLSFDEISLYYWSLCERELNICDTSNCERLQSFLNSYVAEYSGYSLPQALCRDLFTHLYNKEFATKLPYTWEEVKGLYDSCATTLNICPADSSGQLLACNKLAGAKKAFHALYDNNLSVDCDKVFTSLFNQYYETPFTSYLQLTAWANDNCGISYDLCGTPADTTKMVLRSRPPVVTATLPPRLCSTLPLFPTVTVEEEDPCKFLETLAWNQATEQYNVYVQNQKDDFDTKYQEKCLGAASLESFTVTSQVAEYHYTLYYYDQAGNLVKTIPPAGVNPDFSETFYNAVEAAKVAGTEKLPAHTLSTQYRYNTLNQVIAQKSPDGGLSKFWYDLLGRLVVSQNAKQAIGGKYSYTKYDDLGRIKEVGQLTGDEVTQALTQNKTLLDGWFADADNTREQITTTIYDEPQTALCSPPPSILCQQNLRNRVSYTTLKDLAADADYASATYYTYDIHGNVDILLQHYNKGIMQQVEGNAFKKMVYKYDLVSGKVNEVAYQPGIADQFYHRYEYDAENKLTEVYTSHDYVYWERQAAYTYYRHGPLARTEIGQLGVQGIDYAYTLQGWLKGVNSTSIGNGFDMGGDGETGARVARDAYGFSLNYYQNYTDFNSVVHSDYKSVNTTVAPFATVSNGLPINGDGIVTGKDLFNGNIRAMMVNVPKLGEAKLYGYQYDQLNRITAMNAYNGLDAPTNAFTTPVAISDYKERVSYDANGNILSYLRNGNTTGLRTQAQMDDLDYSYYVNTNRLRHVTDAVNSSFTTDIEDIETQNTDNYIYDEIGNLVIDKAEGLYDASDPTKKMIEWNVYGKISKITKIKSGVTTVIEYTYDASGNRITKTVIPPSGGGGAKTTAYIRDASGNVMAVYENGNNDVNSGHLTQTEVHLYGSSRIGLWKANRDVEEEDWWLFETTGMPGTNGGQTAAWERGQTVYELSNHLGNVLVTISDKKKGIDVGTDGDIDYYEADVLTANDYYPGGMDMPGRQYNSETGYRYGFNGKEKDTEGPIQYDYGFRIYDPRLVRFKSVDPLAKSFPFYTPYQFAGNKPIYAVDLDGLEDCPYHKTSSYKKNEKGEVVFEMLSDKDWNKREEDMRRAEMGYFVPEENTPNWARPVFGIANTLLTTIGAATELPAQAHYGDKINIEDKNDVFPLTGDGNIKRLFAEAVTAPAYLLKEIINNPGDTEKWGELAVSLFLMRKVGSAKSFEATLSKRVNLANDFYMQQGYSPSRTIGHLEGIHFGKAVQTTTLKKGTVVQQWVGENGVGDYFTSLENGAKQNLGIPDGYELRTLEQFVLNEDVKVLKSTAAEYKGQAGGGVQYFSAELKSKITKKR